MCSVSLTDGVVSVNAKSGLVSSKSTVYGGVTSTLGITEGNENVSQLKCVKSGTIVIEEGGAYDIRGNALKVAADLDEEATLVVNSDGSDSEFNLSAGVVAHSLSDNSNNNSTYIYAQSAISMINNGSHNKVTVDAGTAQYYTGDGSKNNVIDSSYGSNNAVISGENNEFISHGESTINISENAQKTKILGSDTGDDTVNDKAGSTGKTEGKTYYVGRNPNGNVKLTWAGTKGIADIRNILSSEINYYGSYNIAFAQETYADESGKVYNLQDYLYKYGWT